MFINVNEKIFSKNIVLDNSSKNSIQSTKTCPLQITDNTTDDEIENSTLLHPKSVTEVKDNFSPLTKKIATCLGKVLTM